MINEVLKTKILDYLKKPLPADIDIVDKSVPIPFFGDIEKARIATIGINPSNKEFVADKYNNLLRGGQKRFVDRDFLDVENDSILTDPAADMVYKSLITYFYRTATVYKTWFNWLENFVGSLFGASYYDGSMVNLDIYPWATAEKWSDLPLNVQKSALNSYTLLNDLLLSETKTFDFVYINGTAVKNQLESVLKITIQTIDKIQIQNKIYSVFKSVLPNGCVLIGVSFYLQREPLTIDNRSQIQDIIKSCI